MKHNTIWSVVIPIVLIVVLLAIPAFVILGKMGYFTPNPTAEVMTTAPEGAPELVFVADYDYDPYSFLNADGTPNGMDVEIAYELANRLGMRPRIEFGTWSECKEKIKNGEADVLLGLEIFVDGAGTGTLKSIPVGSDTLSIIGRDSIDDAAALSEKRIGVSFGSALIGLFKLNCEYVEYFTYSEMLEALNKGEIDYGICHASVASRIIEKNGYALKPSLVLMESFPTMGIRQDEPELQVKINHSLEDMSSDGTIAALREKWIVTNVQNRTVADVFRNNEGFFILYCIFAIVLLAGYYVALVSYRSAVERKKSLETVQAQQKSLEKALDEATKEQLRTNLLHDIIHSGKWSFYISAEDEFIGGDVSAEANALIRNEVPADGRSWLDIVHPDDRDNAARAFRAAIEDHSCRTPYDVNYRMKDRNGEYRWFHSAGRMIRNKDGSGEFFGIHVDITSQIEEQLIQQKLLEEARVSADAANKAKTDFLFNMSHDIRTPMNAIIGFTDKAIKHQGEPTVLEESLEKVKTSSEYLLRIINDILDMAKIESGKLELNEELHYGSKGSTSLIEVFGAEAARKGIEFHTDYDVKDKYFWLDENRGNQIVANLISNAIKYTQPGGDIWYSVKQIPCEKAGYGRYTVTVEDNGMGMSQEFLTKIFDAFEREQSAIKSGEQGTGLGMAIVKKLIDAMGASIEIQSEQGKGTMVSFTADHRLATPEEIDAYLSAEKDSISESIDYSGKRILLVEDNELNREIAIEILEEEGFIVDYADDGTTAVEKLKETGSDYYDFVLMDIQMPIMNGYEATKAIRKLFPDASLPIIALSANAFEEDRAASMEAGMNDHVAKPINVEELFRVLAKYQ